MAVNAAIFGAFGERKKKRQEVSLSAFGVNLWVAIVRGQMQGSPTRTRTLDKAVNRTSGKHTKKPKSPYTFGISPPQTHIARAFIALHYLSENNGISGSRRSAKRYIPFWLLLKCLPPECPLVSEKPPYVAPHGRREVNPTQTFR